MKVYKRLLERGSSGRRRRNVVCLTFVSEELNLVSMVHSR